MPGGRKVRSVTSGIGNKMAAGAAWMVLVRILDRSVGLLSTIILARILVPSDFGLVALATALGGVLDLLGAFSFETALIQNPVAERRHYDTAWVFNVLFGIFCAITLSIISAPAARFYNEPRLENIMYVLSACYFISGFGNIGTVKFRKDFQFKDEFVLQFSRRIIMFIITVTGAYVFRSYWALVLGILVGRIAGVGISYVMHSYRPKFSLSGWNDLIRFSKWLLFYNWSYFINQRAADFIIGRVIGSHGLGLYTLSYEISNMPTTEISAPINRAVFPGYAKMALDNDSLRKGYLNVISALAIFAVPAGVGIAIISKHIVPVILGEKWLEAIPIIQVLAIFGALNVIQNNCGMIYMAQGESRLTTILSASFSALLILFIMILIPGKGVMGVAWAYLLTSGIIVPINLYITGRRLRMRARDYWDVLNRPVFASLLMAAIYVVAENGIVSGLGVAPKAFVMIAMAGFGSIIYASMMLILWLIQGKPDGFEKIFLQKMSALSIL
jgi:O-antigen/teichoic acid export membrane protein